MFEEVYDYGYNTAGNYYMYGTHTGYTEIEIIQYIEYSTAVK